MVDVVVTNPNLAEQITQLNSLLGQLTQFTAHLSTGAMSAHVIQWLKTRPSLARVWSMLSDRGKVIAGMIAAALPAAGIVLTFQHPTADAYGFMATGVTGASLGKFVWSLSQNWVFQQGWYQSVIKAKPVTGVERNATETGSAQPVVVTAVKP